MELYLTYISVGHSEPKPKFSELFERFIAVVFCFYVILHSGSAQLLVMTAASLPIISMNVLEPIASSRDRVPFYSYLSAFPAQYRNPAKLKQQKTRAQSGDLSCNNALDSCTNNDINLPIMGNSNTEICEQLIMANPDTWFLGVTLADRHWKPDCITIRGVWRGCV